MRNPGDNYWNSYCPSKSEYIALLKTYTKITTKRYMNIFTIKEY